MGINERLKKLRTNAKQTQKQVAESIGIMEEAYRTYELGKHIPVAKMIVALADHFDTSTDYILGRTDDPAPLVRRKFDV